jgi:hypothetical protein
MTDTLSDRVGVLTRREIEARILGPLMVRLEEELGRERARRLLAEVIETEARRAGEAMRRGAAGGGDPADLRSFAAQWEPWTRDGALEIETQVLEPGEWRFEVRRCRYAELYRDLDMTDLGATLSCRRDAALIDGYDAGVVLERTRTIMEGAACCDFHYRRVGSGEAPGEEPDEAGAAAEGPSS